MEDPLALGEVVADGGAVGLVVRRPLADDDARLGRPAELFFRVVLERFVAEARLRVPDGFAAVDLRVAVERRVDGLRAVEDALRVDAFADDDALLAAAGLRVVAAFLRPVEVLRAVDALRAVEALRAVDALRPVEVLRAVVVLRPVEALRAVVDAFRAVDALRPVVDAFRRVVDVFRPADAVRVVAELRRRVLGALADLARLVDDAPLERVVLDPDAAVRRVFDPLDFRRVDRFLPPPPGNASTSGCTNSPLLRRSPERTADAAPSCAVRLAT